MGKRKRGGVSAQKDVETEYDTSNNQLAINSYEDVPDSEDDFHINRDKILLDGPEAKRQRHIEQQDIIEQSDEEVLAYSDENSASEDDDEEDDVDAPASESGASDPAVDEDEEFDPDNWGTSKADYYGGDINETEEDALREEEAAREAQQRRLKALREEDFGFDENEWRTVGEEDDAEKEDGGVVTEVLPELHITDDMDEDERMEILSARYPELGPLAKELLELQDVHKDFTMVAHQSQAKRTKTTADAIRIAQWQVLSAYLGCLAMYFALLTSTAARDASNGLPMPPHELHNHETMDYLVKCRDLWNKVKDLEIPDGVNDTVAVEEIPKAVTDTGSVEKDKLPSGSKTSTRKPKQASSKLPESDAAVIASQARRAARLRSTEDSLAQLTEQLKTTSIPRRPVKSVSGSTNGHMPYSAENDDSASDIGDEEPLSADLAAEKAQKKKSLRFYANQIHQKANKRENARAARSGGDEDVPRRERLRDRQERLNKEAERRGLKLRGNTELGGDEDEDEEAITNREREERAREVFGDPDGDEYADMVAAAKAKRDQKARREQAYAQAKSTNARVVPHETGTGPAGRREIGYAIEKNKGLMPRRKKEVKNPRVKKRLRFEDKKKKLRSMKPTFKGGEGRGGYGGELTGIKKGLVKSTKL